jgi:PHP family Zn ribbon phosphoesterase
MPEQDNEKDIKVNVEKLQDEDELTTPMERFFYHQRRALEETGRALEALLPPDFKHHSNEASREFAKGFRVLIDATIDEMKKVSEREIEDDDTPDTENDDNNDDPPSTTGDNKVKVKVD